MEEKDNKQELSLDEIKNKLGEISFIKEDNKPLDKTPAKAEENETRAIINEVHKQAIVETVKQSEEVQKTVLEQAKASIENELESLNQEGIARKQQTTYDANKEACECFGIEQGVQVWKINAMRVLHDFWFVVYLIFSFFTICPVSVFCKGLKKFIKQNWLVVIFGIIIYLIIVAGIPTLIAFLNTKGINV